MTSKKVSFTSFESANFPAHYYLVVNSIAHFFTEIQSAKPQYTTWITGFDFLSLHIQVLVRGFGLKIATKNGFRCIFKTLLSGISYLHQCNRKIFEVPFQIHSNGTCYTRIQLQIEELCFYPLLKSCNLHIPGFTMAPLIQVL